MNKVEGNIVATYVFKGITCRISDAAYAGKSEEDLQHVKESINRVVSDIYWNWHGRQIEKEEEIFNQAATG